MSQDKKTELCPQCRGSGKVPGMMPGKKLICPVCKGKRRIPKSS